MSLQSVMRALSDPSRREILNLLKKEPMTATRIGEHFDMSAPAVSKHLGILKEVLLWGQQGGVKMKKTHLIIAVLVLLWIACTCVFLSVAPDRVPVHFGANGEVDRWGSKYEYLIFPGVGVLVAGLQFFGGKLLKKKTGEGNEKVAAVSSVILTVFLFALSVFFMVKALSPHALQSGLNGWEMKSVGLTLMVLFIVMGNIMPKVRRNSSLGLRTKWSMYSDTCWQKSQRLGGYTMLIGGAGGILPLALLPAGWTPWVLLGLLGVLLTVCLVGSYRIYCAEREKE